MGSIDSLLLPDTVKTFMKHRYKKHFYKKICKRLKIENNDLTGAKLDLVFIALLILSMPLVIFLLKPLFLNVLPMIIINNLHFNNAFLFRLFWNIIAFSIIVGMVCLFVHGVKKYMKDVKPYLSDDYF